MGLDSRRLRLGGLHARPLAQAQAHAKGGAGGGGRWRGGRLGLAWGAARRGVGASGESRLAVWGLGSRRGVKVRLVLGWEEWASTLGVVVGWAAT